MIRVKIIKNTRHYKQGETLYLTPNEAFGLLDAGYAVSTKDLVDTDYQTKTAAKPKKRRGLNG